MVSLHISEHHQSAFLKQQGNSGEQSFFASNIDLVTEGNTTK